MHTHRRREFAHSFFFSAFFLIASPAWSQVEGPTRVENPQKIEKGKYLKAETDIALVNVSVTDPYGRLVTGLEQENFRVFEDNVEQEIVRFSSEDVPISIGVIFDMSGSMADKIEKSRLAAVQFFRTANPQDEFFLINFNDRAQLASSFTGSVEELQNHLMFTAARGETALLDGIYLGLSEMKGAHNTKKALLIISDGGDNHSRYTETDIRKYAREADVQIYAIGLYEPGGGPDHRRAGGPNVTGGFDADDRRPDVRGRQPERSAGHRHQNQHGVAQSICGWIQTKRSRSRRKMAQNQNQAAPAQGTSAAYRLCQDRVLRAGPLGIYCRNIFLTLLLATLRGSAARARRTLFRIPASASSSRRRRTECTGATRAIS